MIQLVDLGGYVDIPVSWNAQTLQAVTLKVLIIEISFFYVFIDNIIYNEFVHSFPILSVSFPQL